MCGCESTPVGHDVTGDVGPSPTGEIRINEVSPNGSMKDWVELYNGTETAIDLGGWVFTDSDPSHVYTFPDATIIQPGAFLVIFKSETTGFDFGLGNEDQVLLYDSEGNPVDSVSWKKGDAPSDTSYGRLPDGSGAFITLYDPTPGGPNESTPPTCGNELIEYGEACDGSDLDAETCVSLGYASGNLKCASDCQTIDRSPCKFHTSTVVINEFTSSDSDAIELYNTSDQTLDLTGWTLSDARGKASDEAYTFPAGTEIEGKAFFVITNQTFNFGLGSDDAVSLYDTNGLVDYADYGEGEAVVSFCRDKDGTGTWGPCDPASLGESNQ